MGGAVTYLSERTEGTRTDSMGTIMSGRLDLCRYSLQRRGGLQALAQSCPGLYGSEG